MIFALPDHVVDNDGVRVLQEAGQLHGNLREPHARTAEDLNRFDYETDEFGHDGGFVFISSLQQHQNPQNDIIHAAPLTSNAFTEFPMYLGEF